MAKLFMKCINELPQILVCKCINRLAWCTFLANVKKTPKNKYIYRAKLREKLWFINEDNVVAPSLLQYLLLLSESLQHIFSPFSCFNKSTKKKKRLQSVKFLIRITFNIKGWLHFCIKHGALTFFFYLSIKLFDVFFDWNWGKFLFSMH